MLDYHAPWWLPGGHLQTIWPALFARPRPAEALPLARERWRAPDGDFIDVDHLQGPDGAPWLVLFHGLEGSSSSRYAIAFAQAAQARGWRFSIPHFRGCSGEINLAPRSYHSGDFEEIGWLLGRVRERAGRPVIAAGVSLGGNALLRWAEEAGDSAAQTAQAVAAISAPLDLIAAGAAIDQGLNRQIYTRNFLRTMKPRAVAKLQQHPGLFDRARLEAATTLRAFDDAFTAPLHGFRDVDDYWTRASARPHLHRIRVPALVLNARNDPFVPGCSLPAPHQVGDAVTLAQPDDGGHVGFATGPFPGAVHAMPEAVCDWLGAV
ncbi:MAG: alpha/beta fold hydrolase [Rhodopseudomonas palustris]|uniref:Alpha/beta fold hydrolase n=1 Tax=Rhodopseudomonas palustris TaxID=1076 RepID=A0A933VZ32_RHOPL|nr:alpha/beta fold hydrolase [Rhodopseudomonas palustris]